MKTILFLIVFFISSLSYAQSYNWPPGACLFTAASAADRLAMTGLAAGCLVVQTDTNVVYEFDGSGFIVIGPSTSGGISSLNAQMGASQIFANDSNFTITSSNNTHQLGWASTLSLARGGSGASLTGLAGGMIYSASTSAMGVLAAGTSGQFLKSGGASSPTWGMAMTSLGLQTGTSQSFANDTNIIITSSNDTHSLGWSGTLSMARGGTSAPLSPALGNIVYTDASKMVLLPAGTSGQILISTGAGAPTWSSTSGFLNTNLANLAVSNAAGNDINMSSHYITNVLDPVNAQDAATKAYVDMIGSGITTLNAQTGASQIFANDNNLTITSSNNTHQLGWSSTLSTARGGTGAAITPALGNVVYTDGSKFVVLPAGTSGQFLRSNGGAAPSWVVPTDTGITSLNSQTGTTQIFSNDTNVTITSSNNTHALGFTGTLSLTRGGTGAAVTAATGGVVYGASTSAMSMTVAGTSGQILTSAGASAPTWTAPGAVNTSTQAVGIASASSIAANGSAIMVITLTSGTNNISTITGCDSGVYAQGQQITLVASVYTSGTITLINTVVGTATADSLVLGGSGNVGFFTSAATRGSTYRLMCFNVAGANRWLEVSRSLNSD